MNASTDEELQQQLYEDIKTWENQSVEFKTRATSDHQLAESIAGFATSNVGRIYIGVSDNREITGVDVVEDGAGKDRFQRRIANIARNIIKPPIRVRVHFIDIEGVVVARINIPKGEEPIYYVDYRPYIRDLSITRKLEPSEVKNIYYQNYRAYVPPAPEETTNFLTETLMQLSDLQVISSDYEDHLINPDVSQMQYDLGATGKRLLQLSTKRTAREMGIADGLKELGNKLEDLEMYQFYMGKESVNEFGRQINESKTLADKFYEQIKKNAPRRVVPNYAEVFEETVELFKNEWEKAPRYRERGEIERLRESFRRFGYNFHRLGSLPDADAHNNLSIELREIGEKARNLSSTYKYFLPVAAWNPIEKVKQEVEAILAKLEQLKLVFKK